MYKVAVLMSTYNGEKYLKEQINSILAQIGVEITLYIRDDGSTDETVTIINEYKGKHSNVYFIHGENIGVGNSFMELVYKAGRADYYAFSDQDDVWLPEKLIKAIEKSNKEIPQLYCSNQIIVDKNLTMKGKRFIDNPNISYLQIMCKNNLTGCTMVWNDCLQKIVVNWDNRPTKELLKQRIHDVWLPMVAIVAGEIVYDENAYILYRQHASNVVGAETGGVLEDIQSKLNKIIHPGERKGRSTLAKEIYTKFEFDEDKYPLLVAMAKNDKRRMLKDMDKIIHCSSEWKCSLAAKIIFGLI